MAVSYESRIKGHLNGRWARRVQGMKGSQLPSGLTVLAILLALAVLHFALGAAPALAAGEPPVAQHSGPHDPKELQAFIDGLMLSWMETYHFPGAAVSVVMDGQIAFQKGYGYADVDGQAPVDPSTTLFRVGSTTKLFTWTAVMQLAERGRLDLDMDVNAYLDFEIPDTFPEPITLKNLMTHTPGFEERNEGHFQMRAEDVVSLGEYLKNHIPARVFPPGKVAAYSNYGAALAGYIVERVSGVPFEQYVADSILAPLGMTKSTLRQPPPAALKPGLSGGYRYTEGGYVASGFEYAVDSPAGALSSTAADMARFMLAHLQDGTLGETRILSTQTARLMKTRLFTYDPRIPGMTYGFFETCLNGRRIIWHGGDTALFHSGLWLIPDENTGIFITTNSGGGAVATTLLISEYMDHYYPCQPTPARGPTAGFADRVKPYLGTYYSVRRNFTTFERLMSGMPPCSLGLDSQGNLVLRQSGGEVQLAEIEPGLYRARDDEDVQLVLHTDEAGRAFIMSSDPWAYMKAPWYGTVGFRDLVMRLAVLLGIGTLLASVFSALGALLRRGVRACAARAASWVAASFSLVSVVLFLGLDSALIAKEPVFGYPAILIDKPPIWRLLMRLPFVLAGLLALMLAFTIREWIQRRWTLGQRVHYSLLTLVGLAAVWGMWYWGLLS